MSYTITGYKQIGSLDGVAFEAVIHHRGKHVGNVFNSGTGGPNTYHFPKHEQRAAFLAAARAWGPEETYEVEDAFTEYLIQESRYERYKKANAKKGFPVTVVVQTDEFADEIIGLRELAQVEEVRTEHVGRPVRVL